MSGARAAWTSGLHRHWATMKPSSSALRRASLARRPENNAARLEEGQRGRPPRRLHEHIPEDGQNLPVPHPGPEVAGPAGQPNQAALLAPARPGRQGTRGAVPRPQEADRLAPARPGGKALPLAPEPFRVQDVTAVGQGGVPRDPVHDPLSKRSLAGLAHMGQHFHVHGLTLTGTAGSGLLAAGSGPSPDPGLPGRLERPRRLHLRVAAADRAGASGGGAAAFRGTSLSRRSRRASAFVHSRPSPSPARDVPGRGVLAR